MPTQGGSKSLLLAGAPDTHQWAMWLDSRDGKHSLSITGYGNETGTPKVLSVANGELTHILVDFNYNTNGEEKVTVYVNGKSLPSSSSDTDSTIGDTSWASTAVFQLGNCSDSQCPDASVSAFRVLTYARDTSVDASEFTALYHKVGAAPFAHANNTVPQMCLRPIKAPEFTFNFGTDTKVSCFRIIS